MQFPEAKVNPVKLVRILHPALDLPKWSREEYSSATTSGGATDDSLIDDDEESMDWWTKYFASVDAMIEVSRISFG